MPLRSRPLSRTTSISQESMPGPSVQMARVAVGMWYLTRVTRRLSLICCTMSSTVRVEVVEAPKAAETSTFFGRGSSLPFGGAMRASGTAARLVVSPSRPTCSRRPAAMPRRGLGGVAKAGRRAASWPEPR